MAQIFGATAVFESDGGDDSLEAIRVDDNNLAVGDCCIVMDVYNYSTAFFYKLIDYGTTGDIINKVCPAYSTGTTPYTGTLVWQILSVQDGEIAA